ncbi:hypothetical protein [Streptomyces sp. RKAG293]|uniref:hypothetical protein n=1 Tax=Streptomyces sp. RKAG293 TaxID=2893403 RepID=UPI0020338899|nr:hypothetical protein [Streptomyces sp. RKAG293]MCM2420629.1 hypothetical protein [Streptomyces sp. RKAG293]
MTAAPEDTPVLWGPPRAYPLDHVPGDDRFTEQFVKSMGALLVAHGYPPLDNLTDWGDFELALVEFLFDTHNERRPV